MVVSNANNVEFGCVGLCPYGFQSLDVILTGNYVLFFYAFRMRFANKYIVQQEYQKIHK